MLAEISKYLGVHGFFHMKLEKLKAHLLTVLPEKQVPAAYILSDLLREKFAIRYTSIDKSNLKYRDPAFDEKRRWISKLVTQFLHDGLIIISLDESNFKHSCENRKGWEFKPNKKQFTDAHRGIGTLRDVHEDLD